MNNNESKSELTAEEFLNTKYGDKVKYLNDVLSVKNVIEDMEEYHNSKTSGVRDIEKLREENTRLRNLLEDVVNELDLSGSAIEKHGPLGTAPSELVKLVLHEKDLKITALKNGFKDVQSKGENIENELLCRGLNADKLAHWLHDNYEEIAKQEGWITQENCKVEYKDLPIKNKQTMFKLATRLLKTNFIESKWEGVVTDKLDKGETLILKFDPVELSNEQKERFVKALTEIQNIPSFKYLPSHPQLPDTTKEAQSELFEDFLKEWAEASMDDYAGKDVKGYLMNHFIILKKNNS